MSSGRVSGRNPTRKRRRPAKMNDTWPDEPKGGGAHQNSLSVQVPDTPKKGKQTPRGNKKNSKKVSIGKVAKKQQPKDRKPKKEKAPKKGSQKTPRTTKSSKQAKQQRDAKFREAESRTMALESQAELEYSFGQGPDDEPLEFVEEDDSDLPVKSSQFLPLRETKPIPQRSPAICQPIVYGSIAWWLGRKADEQSSHKWTVFLRGVDCEDLSYLLDKVIFQLHSSFEKPKRVVTRHPFEVTEHGWGEFEVKLQLHFVDPDEPPVEVFHQLRLYPPGSQQPSMKRPVVSEFYDEIVFNRPTDMFTRLLLSPPPAKAPPHPLRDLFTDFSEENDVKSLMAAQNYISKEIDSLQQRVTSLQSLDMNDAAAAAAAGFGADASAMQGKSGRSSGTRKGAAPKGGRRRAGRSGF